jgi:HSP20 family protein
MDDIFDSMIADIENAFYNPRLQSLQHNMMRSRPSTFFLQRGAHNALDSVQITHDDKQHKLVMDVQGASANDIVLHLEEDERMLRISGETKQEDGGISVHSRFDRSFKLDRDVDMSKISAQIDDGVLTIVAPKYELEEVKKNIRRIDIVENKNIDSVAGNGASRDEQADTPASTQNKEEESPAILEQEVVDENVDVIDLDLKTE